MHIHASMRRPLRIAPLILAALALVTSVADSDVSGLPPCAAAPSGNAARAADRVVRLFGSIPQSFADGQRVTLCGSLLFNTYEANSTSARPNARMLRIGDWYLPMSEVVVSNRGDRLSFTVAAGGPYQRQPVSSGTHTRHYEFVSVPVTGGSIAGPIALHSLSSPPDAARQHSTDVVALSSSLWRGPSIQRREIP